MTRLNPLNIFLLIPVLCTEIITGDLDLKLDIMRACANLADVEVVTESILADCARGNVGIKNELVRKRRSFQQCFACRKKKLFVAKSTLEKIIGDGWRILTVDGRTQPPRTLIDVSECKGHCRTANREMRKKMKESARFSIRNQHKGTTFGCAPAKYRSMVIIKNGIQHTIDDILVESCSCHKFHTC